MTPPEPASPAPDPPTDAAAPAPPSAPGEVIHLRGPADVVATLPYHLGYQPTDSLVLIGLHGPKGSRLGVVARVDLPATPDEAWATADAVTPLLLAQEPRRLLLVAYEDSPAAAGTSDPLSRAVRGLAEDAGVEVAERLVVREGRYWSPDCTSSCCPDDGLPVPAPVEVPAVADYVLLGRAPLPHRDDLVGLLTPTDDDGDRREEVVELGLAFQGPVTDPGQERRRGTAPGPATGPGLHPEGHGGRQRALRDWGLAAWRTLLTEHPSTEGEDEWSPYEPAGSSSGGSPLPDSPPPASPPSARSALRWLRRPRATAPDLGVVLAASLRDVTLRDLVVTWLCPGSLDLDLLDAELVTRAREVLPTRLPEAAVLKYRLAALCRATPPEMAAPVLTVFANLVWWHGDGALARTALDLALAQEPDYRLALLLERMLDLAIPPRRGVA